MEKLGVGRLVVGLILLECVKFGVWVLVKEGVGLIRKMIFIEEFLRFIY